MKKVIFFVSSEFSLQILNNLDKNILDQYKIELISNSYINHKYKKYDKNDIFECDLAISIGFSEKLQVSNIISNYGAFNIHQSILPDYRGRHPIQAMIINGEKKYGCTLHFLEKEYDTGKIVQQTVKTFKSVPNEVTVRRLMVRHSVELVEYLFLNYKSGFKNAKKQERTVSKIAPKRIPSDSRITKNLNFQTIKNMTKALMNENYRPYIIMNSKRICIKNVYLYNLKNKKLIKFNLNEGSVFLEKY